MTGNTTNSLYTLDIITGEATLIATKSQLTGTSGPQPHLSGVASHKGELYITTSGSGGFYHVDLDALQGTPIGSDNFGTTNETHPTAAASHGNPAKLYMLGNNNNALYTLDIITGQAARVGTFDNFAVNETTPVGLASHNNKLYMIGRDNNQLYQLNIITGAATRHRCA